MEVVPFEIAHFDALELKPGSPIQREMRPVFEAYGKLGPAITMLNDVSVIACAGVICGLWQGFGEFWMLPGVLTSKYPIAVWKAALSFVNGSIENMGLYRAQATIRESDLTAINWIERLGFHREGLMECFGPNKENHFLYARIKKCQD